MIEVKKQYNLEIVEDITPLEEKGKSKILHKLEKLDFKIPCSPLNKLSFTSDSEDKNNCIIQFINILT